MTLYSSWLVYPDGDLQEITHTLRIGWLVDLNGNPLPVPVTNTGQIVYRVSRIATHVTTGEEKTLYHLELMRVDELER